MYGSVPDLRRCRPDSREEKYTQNTRPTSRVRYEFAWVRGAGSGIISHQQRWHQAPPLHCAACRPGPSHPSHRGQTISQKSSPFPWKEKNYGDDSATTTVEPTVSRHYHHHHRHTTIVIASATVTVPPPPPTPINRHLEERGYQNLRIWIALSGPSTNALLITHCWIYHLLYILIGDYPIKIGYQWRFRKVRVWIILDG